jgi:hypothetical protein
MQAFCEYESRIGHSPQSMLRPGKQWEGIEPQK